MNAPSTLRSVPPHGEPDLGAASAPRDLVVFARETVFADRVGPATIHVSDGLIVAIEPDRQAPDALDFGSDILVPGLVELHTDNLEPHYEPRPKVQWDPLAAVFAYDGQIATSGITTVFDSLRVGFDSERHTLPKALFALSRALDAARATGLLRADHLTHLRCEVCSMDVLSSAAAFLDANSVQMMSLMDHTPGQRQFRDEGKLRDYYRGKAGKSDAELDIYFEERHRLHAANAVTHRRALVAMAQERGVALASHDDTTLEHVAESAADGMAIAEFPTTVEAASASHAAGLAVLMGAPNVVRGGSHSGNVSARDLAQAGLLDILSSDYVPASLLMGAFALRDVEGVGNSEIGGLAGAIRLVTLNPARATGLTDRGAIATGLRADLVRVAMTGQWPVAREVYRFGSRVA